MVRGDPVLWRPAVVVDGLAAPVTTGWCVVRRWCLSDEPSMAGAQDGHALGRRDGKAFNGGTRSAVIVEPCERAWIART